MTRKAALAIESLMQSRGKRDSVLKKGHRVDHDKRDCSGLALSARLTHPDDGTGGEWLGLYGVSNIVTIYGAP